MGINTLAFLAQTFGSVVVGVGAAYISIKVGVATLRERVSNTEGRLESIEKRVGEYETGRSENSERLARIETMLEYLLDVRQGEVSDYADGS